MKKIGYLAVVLTTIIWGFSFVSIKIALNIFTPIGIVFFRYLIAAVFFLGIMFKRKETFSIDKSDIKTLLGSSVFGVVLYFYCESMGIDLLNASTSAIILALVPLVIMISNNILHNERLSLRKILAIIASVVGVVVLVLDDFSLSGGNLLGYLLMFGAVILWAYYSETSSRLTKKYSELKITAFQAFIAVAIYLPFIFFQDIDYSEVTMWGWINIAYLGIISSALGFFLYVYGIKKVGPTETGLFVNFIPVVTVFFGFIILGERLSLLELIGGLIIIISMTIAVYDDFKISSKRSI